MVSGPSRGDSPPLAEFGPLFMTDCSKLWPEPPISEREHWGLIVGKLCRKYGIEEPLKRGFLLAIRGAKRFSRETHPTVSKADYDDTAVLLTADGLLPPYVFEFSTHAYQLDSKLSPDVNHDGRGDVATIDPGYYVAHARGGKYPVFEVTMPDGSVALPCHRDVDHDGIAEVGGCTADGVLIHTGYDAPADSEHHSSIACQTTRVDQLRTLEVEAIRHGGDLTYVLELAEDLLPLIPDPIEAGVA